MNLHAGSNGDTDLENRLLDTRVAVEVGTIGESSIETYTPHIHHM